MEEIWKDINGFENLYKISNLGRVMSLNYNHTGKPGILKQIKNKDGYLNVKLHNGKCYTKLVHRLVAEHFIEKTKLEVNHLDGDRTNNSAENLEWCTHAENERYSYKCLGKKEKRGGKKTNKVIIQYDLSNNYIRRWNSAIEAGRALCINSSKILMCCRKERNKTGGYKWSFENK